MAGAVIDQDITHITIKVDYGVGEPFSLVEVMIYEEIHVGEPWYYPFTINVRPGSSPWAEYCMSYFWESDVKPIYIPKDAGGYITMVTLVWEEPIEIQSVIILNYRGGLAHHPLVIADHDSSTQVTGVAWPNSINEYLCNFAQPVTTLLLQEGSYSNDWNIDKIIVLTSACNKRAHFLYNYRSYVNFNVRQQGEYRIGFPSTRSSTIPNCWTINTVYSNVLVAEEDGVVPYTDPSVTLDMSTSQVVINAPASPSVGKKVFYYLNYLDPSLDTTTGFCLEINYEDSCQSNSIVPWTVNEVFTYDSGINNGATFSWELSEHDDNMSLSMGVKNSCGTYQYALQSLSSTTGQDYSTVVVVQSLTAPFLVLEVTPYSFDTEGTEVWTLTVTLVDDKSIQADIVITEEIEILYTGLIVNNPPYFDPPLTDDFPVSVQRTHESESWEVELPGIIDPDGDQVDVTVDFGSADFIQFDDQSLRFTIDDLSDSDVESGFYAIGLTLDDGENTLEESIQVIIRDPDPLPEPEEEEQPEGEIIEEQEEVLEEAEDEQEVQEQTPEECDNEQDTGSCSNIEQAATEEEQEAENLAQSTFDWREAFKAKEKKRQNRLAQEEVKLIQPVPYLTKISQSGQVIISFNTEMHMLPSLGMLEKATVKVQGKEMPVFEVQVIPGQESDSKQLDFTWKVEEMTPRELKIQIFFKTALYVSSGNEPEILRISFNDKFIFVSQQDIPIEFNTGNLRNLQNVEFSKLIIERVIPSQIQLGSAHESFASAVTTASESSKLMTLATFAFNIAISASLNQLWTMINTQQLIVLMPLFDIKPPANVNMLFEKIMEIAAFDLFEVNEPLDKLLNLEPTDPFNERFATVGFESIYLLNNLGTLNFAYIAWILAALVTLALRRFALDSDKVNTIFNKMRKLLFFNTIISIYIESYSLLAVCCLINLNYLSFESYGLTIHSVTAIVVLLAVILLPPFLARHLLRFFSFLKEKKMRSAYAASYEELDLRAGRIVLIQPLFFLARRMMLAMAIVMVNKVLIWQIMLMTAQIVIAVIIVGRVQPFRTPQKRRTEIFNEVILMMVMYCVMCFSPLVPDVEVKFLLGYVCQAFIISHLLVNFAIIGGSTLRKIRLMIQLKMAIRRYKTQRKKNQLQLAVDHHKRKRWLQKRKDIVEEILRKQESAATNRESPYLRQQRNQKSDLYSRNKNFQLKTRAEDDLDGDLEQLFQDLESIFPQEKHQPILPDFQKAKQSSLIANSLQHQNTDKFSDIENIYGQGLKVRQKKHTSLQKKSIQDKLQKGAPEMVTKRKTGKGGLRTNAGQAGISLQRINLQELKTIETSKRPTLSDQSKQLQHQEIFKRPPARFL